MAVRIKLGDTVKKPSIKRAKILEANDLKKVLQYIDKNKVQKTRDKVTLLLSVKAGLRAAEIASLLWSDVTRANGAISDFIEITSRVKKGKYRQIPMHPEIKALLVKLRRERPGDELVRYGDYKPTVTPNALTVWFHRLYDEAGLKDCSSHTGRRTFITNTGRVANLFNASLRDVQILAGHANLNTTERYIEPSAGAIAMVNSI